MNECKKEKCKAWAWSIKTNFVPCCMYHYPEMKEDIKRKDIVIECEIVKNQEEKK